MRRREVHSNAFSKPVGDPYAVLGLSHQASEADIKRAYFQLVRQFPPERQPEKFRVIRTAYEQLRDPEQRARMDLFLVQPPPPLPKQRRSSYDLSVHVDDLLTLAMELVRTPMQDDFGEIALPAERPDGR
jgi:curved DNA-binding protein CbpA